MLVCISAQANSEDPITKTITIEGKFLEKKVVKYEVYQIMYDSSTVKVGSYQSIKEFDIQLEVGQSYAIKFTTLDGKQKILYVDVEGGGDFSIDVDFASRNSAKLVLKPGTYSLQMLTPEEAKLLAYVP